MSNSFHVDRNGTLTNKVHLCGLFVEILQNLALFETVSFKSLGNIVEAEFFLLLILEEVGAGFLDEASDGRSLIRWFLVPILNDFETLCVWIIDVDRLLDDIVN